MPNDINATVIMLARSNLATLVDLKGCSHQEIEGIERQYGILLPTAYRDFLSSMGKSAGSLLKGTDFLYSDLLTLRTQAERLLRECKAALILAPEDFVFAAHQGYQFLFFKCGTAPDPPVFLYEERESSYRQVAESFSSWLDGCVQDEIRIEAGLRKERA